MQRTLQAYTRQGGALLVSGAYIGSDMTASDEQRFLANTLRCRYAGRNASTANTINGMGTTMQYWNQLNEQHYAATSVDNLQPLKPAFVAMQYADGYNAAIAYKGSDYRIFTMGFPFECIQSEQKRSSIMRGILNFLLK